ncbi:hypothetical protein Lal_00049479 [Lupinus albus]|nr:hypothetical protein Lal_00049479 [Lupinus albus]
MNTFRFVSGISCRWLNYLRPNIKRGNISLDEEDLIIRLHNLLGNRVTMSHDSQIKDIHQLKINAKSMENPKPKPIPKVLSHTRTNSYFNTAAAAAAAAATNAVIMYLQFYINENGDKVYTTKKESPLGLATQSAHPARFSPDDKYSRQRVLLKKRFGLLPTQQPPQKY